MLTMGCQLPRGYLTYGHIVWITTMLPSQIFVWQAYTQQLRGAGVCSWRRA